MSLQELSPPFNAACQESAESPAVRQALASFRGAAQSWSEAAAGALPPVRARHAAPAVRTWVWPALALAAVILLAVWLPLGREPQPKMGMATAAAVTAQISRDNQLLARIATDVGETTPGALQPLQVSR